MSLQFNLENFGGKEYYICQSDDYKFTIDSIALGYFVTLDKVKTILDLGCATGILEFIIESRKPGLTIKGIEIQHELAQTAKENMLKNDLSNIEVLKGDYIKDNFFEDNTKFDIVFSNPPYMKKNSGVLPEKESEKIAKFEIYMDVEGLFKTANKYMMNNGCFCFVHKAARLHDIFKNCIKFGMGIQRLQFVHSYEHSKAHLVLVECVKRQNIDTKVLEPLIIFEKDGKYKGIFRELFK